MPTPSKIKFFYDPRGQLIRTVNPDGTEQRVIYGKPENIGSLPNWGENDIIHSPWETTTYDANDLGGGAGFNTPKTEIHDALGRTVKTIDRLNNNPNEDVVMKYSYDIQGNLKKVVDALDRVAFLHTYDLRPKEKGEDGKEKPQVPILSWHIDKGNSELLSDVAGKPVEAVDAKGARILNASDLIGRPSKVWARDKAGVTETLRHITVYGDDPVNGPSAPENTNHKGKPYKQYDEAGLVTIGAYDFKGSPKWKEQQVLDDSHLSGDAAFPVDWESSVSLASNTYRTDTEYDALNCPTKIIYPEDINSYRKELLPNYNKAGALESVIFDGTSYVEHIAYNAKGQRILASFGNGVMTRYAYDPLTFRLTRQRSETFSQSGWTFTSLGSVKQDTGYRYDKAGNIIKTMERTTGCGTGGTTDALERQFTYDALYRLLSATGRENGATASQPWDDGYRPNNNNTTTAYTQRYQYDKMGNILQLQHVGASNFTRTFNYDFANEGNRLQSIDVGAGHFSYTYDNCGNQLSETSSRYFEWGAGDELKFFKTEASGTISKKAHYLYSGGKRVKKYWTNESGQTETTIYIDGIFEHTYTSSGEEQNVFHIMDDKSRIAMVRIGDNLGDSLGENGDNQLAIKYILEDHLGSSVCELARDGAFLEKEEYYPFGETSFASYGKKRYKYCGKEKDTESGLYYYGARYYNAWTCRFVSVDPLKDKYHYYTPYQYAGNKPINFIDLDGKEEAEFGNPLNLPNDPIVGLPKWEEVKGIFEAAGRGLRNTAKAIAPVRPAEDGDPKTLKVAWEQIKAIPTNLYNLPSNLKRIYSEGTFEEKVETTFGLGGTLLALKMGKSPQAINLVRSGLEIPKLLNITVNLLNLKGAGIIGKCDIYAKDFITKVSIQGAEIKRYRFESDGFIKFNGEIIADFGKFHEWIEVVRNGQKFIFDNINLNGIKAEEWWSKFDGLKFEDPLATGKDLQKYAKEVKN